MLLRSLLVPVRYLSHRPKVAVVGSGPAGLYTCSAILQRLSSVQIDVIDKSPVPFGLVQFGVAPDHADVKKCANHFERMFTANVDKVSLYCNVAVGSDVSYDELVGMYDAVVLAYGASRARELNLPNTKPKNNVFSGYNFVSWYNGQRPDLKPNLSGATAVIIGNGNVAIDCARVILSDPERFRHTDMAGYALEALEKSLIRNVSILGRRGPLEASFTIKELRELLTLVNVKSSCVIADEVQAQMRSRLSESEIPRKFRRIWELMLKYASSTGPEHSSTGTTGTIQFFSKPSKVICDERSGQVLTLEVQHSLTGKITSIPCSLLIYAIGFESYHLPGVPVDENGHLLLRDSSQVEEQRSNVFAAGWCAKAGGGVIAETQRSSVVVADRVVQSLKDATLKNNTSISDLLKEKRIRYVTWSDWKFVDESERRLGQSKGKPREKIHDVVSFLEARQRC